MKQKELFNKTCGFLKRTLDTAGLLKGCYESLDSDLAAHELDYENFIDEISALCSTYEHIMPE